MENKINIENYEAFWIDYLDGKLNEKEEEELFIFLEENQKIIPELIDSDSYKVPEIHIAYPHKNKLLSENQIENMIIAKIENSISNEDDIYITKQINNNSDISNTYNLYKKTIVVPDKEIIYPDKNKLYKQERKNIYAFSRYMVAASVVLILIAGFLLVNNNSGKIEESTPLLSENENINNNNPVEITEVNPEDQDIHNSGTEDQNNQINTTEVKTIPAETFKPQDQITILTHKDNPQEDDEEISDIIPEKLHVIEPNQILLQANNENVTLDYRTDVPEQDEQLYSYILEYKKSDVEKSQDDEKIKLKTRIKNGVKKLIKDGQEFDIVETFEKIWDARDENLLTTNKK